MEEEGYVPDPADTAAVYNQEGRREAESNFFTLVNKYGGRLQELNRDAFDSSKESYARNVFEVDQDRRKEFYEYCTGEQKSH